MTKLRKTWGREENYGNARACWCPAWGEETIKDVEETCNIQYSGQVYKKCLLALAFIPNTLTNSIIRRTCVIVVDIC